jgi:ACS family hexuronate transporter-like MFS transporter
MPDPLAVARPPTWKWLVCGMLLLATMLNYMDRLTLTQTAVEIKAEFNLNNEDYGLLETAFSVAFGIGAVALGAVADQWNVRWVYPVAVLAWSLVGFATGFVGSYAALLCCRFFLGLSEAGHWPCALRTTQHILPPSQRTLGNGILQSGAAIGAIVTPLVVMAFMSWTGTWRYPFMVVGSLGLVWVFLWLVLVRREDLGQPKTGRFTQALRATVQAWRAVGPVLRDRRFWVLIVVVWSINLTWHYFRVWLPLFLREEQGYSLNEMNLIMVGYYLATDAGSLAAGFATLWLARRGMAVHASREGVFMVCAMLTTLSVVVPVLERGPLLLVFLLVIGFGALGLFPNYYSFSQELTTRHQGKVTGLLGCINWMAVALFQWLVGFSIDKSRTSLLVLAIAGTFPVLGLVVLILFWSKPFERLEPEAVSELNSAS